LSGPLYDAHFDYDKASNTYLRSEGGRPHYMQTTEDPKSLVQLHPNVVIAFVTNYSVLDNVGHSGYGMTGSGSVYVFQDGNVVHGTWNKSDRSSMFEFKDEAGNVIPLDIGQVWITALTDGDMAFTP
jgi:hypothetical protein